MFKSFHQLLFSGKYVRYVKNFHTRLYTRSITGDHVTDLNEGTLTGRLLNYLVVSSKSQPKEVDRTFETFDILRGNDSDKLQKCNIKHILSAFKLMLNPEHCKDKSEFLMILNILDLELCRRLDYLETIDILNVLHTYMNVIPGRIVQYKFYERAIQELFSKISILSKQDLIQFMFYLGLQKKRAKSQYMLRKCMNILNKEVINNLSTEELCIICNSTFKTSTKINNNLFLDKVIVYLNDNLSILKDPAIFTTLIKTLRHNRYQNEELLSTISCTIFFNKTINHYTFPALCHILALYSDYLYYDSSLIKLFNEKCIQLLKDSNYTSRHAYLQEQPRAKDIKRFLWCLSNLNYKNLEKEDIQNVIIPNITKRIENGELKDDFETVVEMALYLWMLNYREPEIILNALTKENIQYIQASNLPTKQRLNLLLTCIYFEDRNLYKKINAHPQIYAEYNIKQQLEKRMLLQKVFEVLKLLPTKFEINKYTLGCQIPHLNVIGITGYKKKIYKAVHIEILDDYTCMKNTDGIPSGLMQLKLRLLEQFDEGIIVIRASEVEAMGSEELSNLLEDELDLVC